MAEVGPRYKEVNESKSGHGCCFAATVVDTQTPLPYGDMGEFDTVCECHTMEAAELVATALNRSEGEYTD